MRLISRHIVRSLAPPFWWGLAALTGMLLLNQLAPLIDQFGGKGLPTEVIVEAVVLQLPALLALSLPMAVLVSTLYAYSQLAADLEMVAMYANGISVWRMARPALIAAAMVTVVNFLLFDQVVPRSNARFAALRNDVFGKTPTLSLQPQILNPLPPANAQVLRAANIDPETGKMSTVTIYDLSQGRTVIVADSAHMAESPSRTDLILTLYDGEALEFEQPEPGRLQRTRFMIDHVRIRDVQNNLRRSSGIYTHNDREMTGCELLDGVDEATEQAVAARENTEYLTRRDLYYLNGLPAVPPPAVRVQPPLTHHCGKYRRFEAWFRELILPGKLEAQQVPVQQAPAQQPVQHPVAPPAAQLPGQFTAPTPFPMAGPVAPPAMRDGLPTAVDVAVNASRNLHLDETERLGFAVEFHKKFAIPLASFCFVLLGMALALKYPRGGIGLVIGASLVIFLGFYILLIGGENLAKKGYIAPALAIEGPLVFLTLLGLVAVRSANREMGTARGTSLVDTMRSLFARGRDHGA